MKDDLRGQLALNMIEVIGAYYYTLEVGGCMVTVDIKELRWGQQMVKVGYHVDGFYGKMDWWPMGRGMGVSDLYDRHHT